MRWTAPVLVLLLWTSAAGLTVDELPPGAVYTLSRIRIEGTETVSKSALRSVMQTRLPPWYQPWKRWLDPPVFNAGLLRSDLERIASWLRESGRYEAEVGCDLVVDGDRVTVVLSVHEGPVVVVKRVV